MPLPSHPLALPLLVLGFPAMADVLAPPEALRGRYVADAACDMASPPLEITRDAVHLGRTSCFIRALQHEDNRIRLDLTACWFGGEVSGDRTAVLIWQGGDAYQLITQTAQELTKCQSDEPELR